MNGTCQKNLRAHKNKIGTHPQNCGQQFYGHEDFIWTWSAYRPDSLELSLLDEHPCRGRDSAWISFVLAWASCHTIDSRIVAIHLVDLAEISFVKEQEMALKILVC